LAPQCSSATHVAEEITQEAFEPTAATARDRVTTLFDG